MKKTVLFIALFVILLFPSCRNHSVITPAQDTQPSENASFNNDVEDSAEPAQTDVENAALTDESTLTFIPERYYARFIAKTDQNTLCVVAKDAVAEEAAIQAEEKANVPFHVWFSDINTGAMTGQCELSGDETLFFAADGRLYTLNSVRNEKVKLSAWDRTGTPVFSMDLTDLYVELPPMIDFQTMLFAYPDPKGEKLLLNGLKDGNHQTILLSFQNGDRQSVPLPVRASVQGFDGENILLQENTEENKSKFSVYNVRGEMLKEWQFGKAKSVTGGERYYAVYDFGLYNGSSVTVLDIEKLKEYEVTLSSAEEGRRFLLSEDGEALLSFDDGNTFRVYDVNENKLIHTFSIGDENFLGMMFSCFDGENSTAFLPCGNKDSFRVLRVRW